MKLAQPEYIDLALEAVIAAAERRGFKYHFEFSTTLDEEAHKLYIPGWLDDTFACALSAGKSNRAVIVRSPAKVIQLIPLFEQVLNKEYTVEFKEHWSEEI